MALPARGSTIRLLVACSLAFLLGACSAGSNGSVSPSLPSPPPTGTPAPTATVETSPSAVSTPPVQAWVDLTIDDDAFSSSTVYAAIAAGPGYVAVGDGNDDPKAWTSSDGRSWTRSEPPPRPKGGSGVTMGDIIAGGPGLVAVGWQMGPNPCAGSAPIMLASNASNPVRAIAWTSTDGVRWTRAPDTSSFAIAAMTHLARIGSTIVAIGTTTRDCTYRTLTWTSPDGVHWQSHSVPAFDDATVQDVVSDGSGLVAVGLSGCKEEKCIAQAWTSADGIAWTSAGAAGLGPIGVSSVASGARGLLAVGGQDSGVGVTWTSSNGSPWLRANPPGMGPLGVVEAVGDGYVAAGEGVIWESPDGVTWRLSVDQSSQDNHPTFTIIIPGPSQTLAIGTVDGTAVWSGPAAIAQ